VFDFQIIKIQLVVFITPEWLEGENQATITGIPVNQCDGFSAVGMLTGSYIQLLRFRLSNDPGFGDQDSFLNHMTCTEKRHSQQAEIEAFLRMSFR
jgi:hypothetical protein